LVFRLRLAVTKREARSSTEIESRIIVIRQPLSFLRFGRQSASNVNENSERSGCSAKHRKRKDAKMRRPSAKLEKRRLNAKFKRKKLNTKLEKRKLGAELEKKQIAKFEKKNKLDAKLNKKQKKLNARLGKVLNQKFEK